MKKWAAKVLTGVLLFSMLISDGNVFTMAAGRMDAIGAEGDVEVNEKNFPDPIFRSFVTANIRGAEDGVLTSTELTGVREIEADNLGISDLTGINYFTHLRDLACDNNLLKSLDVSQLTMLQGLDCSKNSLAGLLDISNLTSLRDFDCSENNLGVLEVGNLTSVRDFNCSNNYLKSLNVSNMTSLKRLDCSSNKLVDGLDLRSLKSLKYLDCGTSVDMGIKFLRVNGLKRLENLDCSGGLFETLDLDGLVSLKKLQCSYGRLETLDLRDSTKLEELDCSSNQLVILKLTGLKVLEKVNCAGNELTSLDLNSVYNACLDLLDCSYNNFSDITDIKGYKKFKKFGGVVRYDPQRQQFPSAAINYKENVAVGKTKYLTMTMKKGKSGKITWNSSNEGVVTVNSGGRIKGIKAGSATVTATAANGKKASCKVTVVKKSVKVWSLEFEEENCLGMKKGSKYQLKPYIQPSNYTDGLKWTSSDKKVVSVAANGVVTAVGKGTAFVQVRAASGKKDKRKVIVV